MDKTLARSFLLAVALPSVALAQTAGPAQPGSPTAKWSAPQMLMAAGQPVVTEEPGYAAPCWHDVDGDGRKDLVVGQFNDGKMKVYLSLEGGGFAAGEWLQAGGKIAEVPGVW